MKAIMEPEETGRRDDPDHAATGSHGKIGAQEEARYSARMIEEACRPRNRGMMLDPDGHAVLSASCGDTIELFLRLDGSRIVLAAFLTNGCAPTVACGSMLTTMVRGLTVEQAAAIDAGDLIIALDGLPPEHVHCATLAVNTLREAIHDCAAAHAQAEGEEAGDAAPASAAEDSPRETRYERGTA